jgi:hypothetical protein
VHVARIAERAWRVTWTAHHLVLDGWSTPLVLREVLDAHAALARGEEPAAPPVRPWRDYVTWLGERDPEPARAFWSERLRGARPTPLPGVRHRGADRDGDGDAPWGDVALELAHDETERVRTFARASGLTQATLVQGAWALLLATQSDREDVLFGTARSGRPAELDGVEAMVGMFVNTLPLRVAVPRRATARTWLVELQARAAELVPFEASALTDVAQWSGHGAGAPLFESLVVFENYPAADGADLGGDLALSDVASHERTRPSAVRASSHAAVSGA